MKLLIIDDNDTKIDQLISVIITIDSISMNDITVCKNIIDAKRSLKTNKYDALLLDMQLPLRDDQPPKPKAGIDFLKEFKNNNKFNHPREIIGITAYEDEFKEAEDVFSDNLLSVIQYDAVSDNWKDRLIERLEYLVLSQEDETGYDYDIAIICALKSPELEAVKYSSLNWEEFSITNDKSTKYYTSNYNGLKIVIASAAQMGMPAATALSMKIISNFKPKYLFMAGICAGVKDKVKIGDILVADLSWDYGSGKIKHEGDKQIFQSEPYTLRLAPELKANVEELKSNYAFLSEIKHNWSGAKPEADLVVHIGPMVSGAAVIADISMIEQIVNQHRKLIGIEMEAYGVMFAAEHCPMPKPTAMVVKSVCDFGDVEKHDMHQAYAAYTSASFIYKFIDLYCRM